MTSKDIFVTGIAISILFFILGSFVMISDLDYMIHNTIFRMFRNTELARFEIGLVIIGSSWIILIESLLESYLIARKEKKKNTYNHAFSEKK